MPKPDDLAANSTDSLEAQVAELRAELKNVAHTLSRMGELSVEEVKNRAGAQAKAVMDQGQSAVENAQDEFDMMEKQLKDTIRARPITAVAGALALGYVLAVLSR